MMMMALVTGFHNAVSAAVNQALLGGLQIHWAVRMPCKTDDIGVSKVFGDGDGHDP